MLEELKSKKLHDLAKSLSSDLAYFGYRNHMIAIHDDDLVTKVVLIKGETVKPVEMILHLIENLPETLKKQVIDTFK